MSRTTLLSALLLAASLAPLPATASVQPICYSAPVFPQPGASVMLLSRILCVRVPQPTVRR